MPADDVRAAKAAYEADIFARANVVGIAIGNKMIRGRETDERCIVVFVEAKRPEGQLRHRDVVPKAFGSIRTDIVETGRFHALRSEQAIDLERTKRIRPAPGGGSTGQVEIPAGTLGVLARRNGRPVILSNNHVLANQNAGRVGDPILQPGPADGGRLQDTIARLVDFVPIQFKEREPGPIARFLARLFGPLLRAAGWRQPLPRCRRRPARGRPPLRRRGDDDADQPDRRGRALPGPRPRVGSARSPPKPYYASVGFAARWGGDEGTLGREVSTEEPGRGRRPGGDRRAPQGLREDGKPAAPPLRGSRRHWQDDVRNRPRPRHVWRGLAPELL